MHRSRRTFLKSAGLLAAVPAMGLTDLSSAKADRSYPDAFLQAAVKRGDVPGIVAAVTNKAETTFSGAYGVRGQGDPVPLSMDSVFFIASMTKPLTSLAALQLVERGKLNLDEPASRYLPELGRLQILEGYDAAGKPKLRPVKNAVTLRHLLTHTSGFTYDIWDKNLNEYYQSKAAPPLGSATKAALQVPLAFEPGEKWEYGIGIDWVGWIVEAASGKRLGQYFQEEITGPLEMRSTDFHIGPDMRARLVKMHSRGGDGSLSVIPFEMNQYPEIESGGAGLYSTVPDYLKFIRMILQKGELNGRRIIRAETVDLLSRNAMGNLRVGPLKTAIPFMSRDAEFFPGLEKTWSLGFMINEAAAPTGRSKGSLSWAGIANTYFWIDPAADIAGVVMMQLLPFVDEKALNVFQGFEKAVYTNQ